MTTANKRNRNPRKTLSERAEQAPGTLEADSGARYSDLYEFAPVGYVTLGKDGTIFESNLTASDTRRCRTALIDVTELKRAVGERERLLLSERAAPGSGSCEPREGQVSCPDFPRAPAAANLSDIQIHVIDTGSGIPADFLAYVFDPFQQADDVNKNRAGLGLGLAIVRQTVEMHGGTVHATSGGEGKGATLTLQIPIKDVHEISVRTLVPVAISTATAAYIGRIFFGDHPSFFIPGLETPNFQVTAPATLVLYVGLGIILGVVSALFIQSIYKFEDFFEQRVSPNDYVRHMLGMCLVGLLMYAMLIATSHYYIEGVGYATIQDVLDGTLVSGSLLLVLFLAKLLATSLTLGSGASGGVFSPSLYIGATLGGAYAVVSGKLFPGLVISPQAFALAGMVGMVGSATGAAMAGIVMTFEMTLDYNVIVATTIAVAISYGMRKVLSDDSIYTLKLVRRGHRVPVAFQTNFHHLKPASAMMETRTGTLPTSTTVEEFARIASNAAAPFYFLVVDGGRVIGVVDKGMAVAVLQEKEKDITLRDIARDNFATVSAQFSFFSVLSTVRSTGLPFTLVVDIFDHSSARNVKGVITSQQLVDSMVEDIELFSDD